MAEKLNIVPHHHQIQFKDRMLQNGHAPLVLWFTGLSGSGKSTIAGCLEQMLVEKNIHTYILDGDNIRAGLNQGLTFSKEDRNENLRRIAEVAKLFVDAGIVVLSAFVSPLKEDRAMVKKIIGAHHFVEIYIATSLEECERRDVKGLYKKARKGEISNFTGLTAPYEAPDNPDLTIQTENRSVVSAATEVFEYLIKHNKLATHE